MINKNTSTNEEIMQLAIDTWGERSQIEMAQEEATELALACRKFIRNPNTTTLKDLGSEMADVEIMLEQLKMINPNLIEICEEQKVFKIDRLKSRLLRKQFEDETKNL